MEPKATTDLTNEHETRLDLALRDILPEIVRRGYWLEICYWPGNTCVRLGQVENGNALKTYVLLGDPPSIARAICEAYRVVMQEEKS